MDDRRAEIVRAARAATLGATLGAILAVLARRPSGLRRRRARKS